MCPKEAVRIASNADPEQTAPEQSGLILVCTIFPELSVREIRIITICGNSHSVCKAIQYMYISGLGSLQMERKGHAGRQDNGWDPDLRAHLDLGEPSISW